MSKGKCIAVYQGSASACIITNMLKLWSGTIVIIDNKSYDDFFVTLGGHVVIRFPLMVCDF